MNFTTVVDSNYQMSASDSIINVNSELNSVVITLPSVASINDYRLKAGYPVQNPNGFTINDYKGFASVNNIVIMPHPDDLFNNQIASVTINQNFGGANINAIANNIWGVSMFGLGGQNNLPIVPKKVYIANFTQVQLNAPVVTELVNTYGAIVWSYAGVGRYIGTLVGAFTVGKTYASSGTINGKSFNFDLQGMTADTIMLQTFDAGGVASNSVLNVSSITLHDY